MKYCKNCDSWSKEAPTSEEGKNIFLKSYCHYLDISTPQGVYNINLDCKYYKRIWYKFWIKE